MRWRWGDTKWQWSRKGRAGLSVSLWSFRPLLSIVLNVLGRLKQTVEHKSSSIPFKRVENCGELIWYHVLKLRTWLKILIWIVFMIPLISMISTAIINKQCNMGSWQSGHLCKVVQFFLSFYHSNQGPFYQFSRLARPD